VPTGRIYAASGFVFSLAGKECSLGVHFGSYFFPISASNRFHVSVSGRVRILIRPLFLRIFLLVIVKIVFRFFPPSSSALILMAFLQISLVAVELVFPKKKISSPLVLMAFPQIFAGDGSAGGGFVIGL
jgi:hypothetical protein